MAFIGLTSNEVEKKLEQFGPNDVEERRSGVLKKFLKPLYSPISLMLLGAAFLSWLDGRIFDFYFILVLYFVNYSVQKWQEFKADKAIAQLREKLSFEVMTFRDGKWIFVSARRLVPGDHIRLGLGSIIPADAKISAATNLTVNEAVISGESLPKEKKIGDTIFSGSFIATGHLEADISATGRKTYFGKTIFSIEQPAGQSILEKDILTITRFLTSISLISVVVLTTIFLWRGSRLDDLLTLDLSLVIAGIPISLPAVMAVILSIGATGLAQKQVIVRRLSALQDLANVNLLLTDKTGTLTKNEIRISNVISYEKNLSTNDIIEFASYAATLGTPDAIGMAILQRAESVGRAVAVEVLHSVPYDSDRKRSTTYVKRGDQTLLVSIGAPQVIRGLAQGSMAARIAKFDQDVVAAAANGYRVLAVATKYNDDAEVRMKLVGLLYLADPLDENSKATLQFMAEHGIGVKILTGDNSVITQRITKELGLTGDILAGKAVIDFYGHGVATSDGGSVVAFAEVLPEDKYKLVEIFKHHHIVAVTGDGINDLAALKMANVGIAVSGAVSALKSLADIVLLGAGLAVIKDAIIESRKIFSRLYNYSIYRISESFRLVITILILGAWYGFYPLLPLQLIVLALLNDIPIISLAFDRVKISRRPAEIKTKQRFILSILFGSVGVLNSTLMFLLLVNALGLPIAMVQTMFFLKLTVSGHALIFVAHTKERWYRYLPSKEVVIATISTQVVATILAVTGYLMPTKISIIAALFVWAWALFWMQVSEVMKWLQQLLVRKFHLVG